MIIDEDGIDWSKNKGDIERKKRQDFFSDL